MCCETGLDVKESALTATYELESDEEKKKELAELINPTYNASFLAAQSNNVQHGALAQLVEQRTLNP